jgi:hypothetical protein
MGVISLNGLTVLGQGSGGYANHACCWPALGTAQRTEELVCNVVTATPLDAVHTETLNTEPTAIEKRQRGGQEGNDNAVKPEYFWKLKAYKKRVQRRAATRKRNAVPEKAAREDPQHKYRLDRCGQLQVTLEDMGLYISAVVCMSRDGEAEIPPEHIWRAYIQALTECRELEARLPMDTEQEDIFTQMHRNGAS